ncbi:hypothetical protein F7725_025351, partial [Dissostichus mawsoni]
MGNQEGRGGRLWHLTTGHETGHQTLVIFSAHPALSEDRRQRRYHPCISSVSNGGDKETPKLISELAGNPSSLCITLLTHPHSPSLQRLLAAVWWMDRGRRRRTDNIPSVRPGGGGPSLLPDPSILFVLCGQGRCGWEFWELKHLNEVTTPPTKHAGGRGGPPMPPAFEILSSGVHS